MADSNALLASLLMGQKKRSDPLEDQRKFGMGLMQQGSSTAPVLSPWEGVARALQGGIGGLTAGYSDMQEKEQDAGNITALSKAATETTPEGIARALQGVKGNSEMMVPVLGQIIQGRLDKAQKDDVARGGLDAGLNAFGIKPGAGPSGQGGYQPTLGRYESGNNPQAVNPVSGAGGEYQFLQPTWNDTRAKNPDLNLPPTVLQASQQQQAAAEQRLRQQNAVELQKFGIEPTPANLYLAHRAGAQGARTILSASPDAPLSTVVPPEWIAQNPDMRTTVGHFVQMAGQRFPSLQSAAPQGQPASSTQSAPANAPQPPPPQFSPAAAQYLQQAQSLRDRDPVRALELVKKAEEAQAAHQTLLQTRQFDRGEYERRVTQQRTLDQPQENFKNARQIREEYSGQQSVKDYRKAETVFKAAVRDAGTNSAAADLNLVYGFATMMDPGSVVREGEMGMVKATQNASDQIKSMVSAVSGGQRISPEARQALVDQMYGRYQEYKSTHDQLADHYAGVAERSGLKREDIVPPSMPAEWTTKGGAKTKTDARPVYDVNGNPI